MEVNEIIITTIPTHIIECLGSVILAVDVMKVDGISFLVSISRVIIFGTATEIANMKVGTTVKAIKKIQLLYKNRGLGVVLIVGDNGFVPLQQDENHLELKETLNLTSEDEHEQHVESFIRTIKEKARTCLSLILFTYLPKRLTVELVYCRLF